MGCVCCCHCCFYKVQRKTDWYFSVLLYNAWTRGKNTRNCIEKTGGCGWALKDLSTQRTLAISNSGPSRIAAASRFLWESLGSPFSKNGGLFPVSNVQQLRHLWFHELFDWNNSLFSLTLFTYFFDGYVIHLDLRTLVGSPCYKIIIFITELPSLASNCAKQPCYFNFSCNFIHLNLNEWHLPSSLLKH